MVVKVEEQIDLESINIVENLQNKQMWYILLTSRPNVSFFYIVFTATVIVMESEKRELIDLCRSNTCITRGRNTCKKKSCIRKVRPPINWLRFFLFRRSIMLEFRCQISRMTIRVKHPRSSTTNTSNTQLPP